MKSRSTVTKRKKRICDLCNGGIHADDNCDCDCKCKEAVTKRNEDWIEEIPKITHFKPLRSNCPKCGRYATRIEEKCTCGNSYYFLCEDCPMESHGYNYYCFENCVHNEVNK